MSASVRGRSLAKSGDFFFLGCEKVQMQIARLCETDTESNILSLARAHTILQLLRCGKIRVL